MKNKQGQRRIYRLRLAVWYPGENTPAIYVSCERRFAKNQREAREEFIENAGNRLDESYIIKCVALRRK